jgi:hypothetical protein
MSDSPLLQNVVIGFASCILAIGVLLKISFDISVKQLQKELPEAEYKIQLAIAFLEVKQA